MRKATILALLLAVPLAACKVKVNDEGKLPDVDVREKGEGTQIEVKPGTMPDVDVSTDSVSLPEVRLPDVKAPDVDLPRVDTTRRDTARRG